MGREAERRRVELRAQYQRTRPTHAEVRFKDHVVRLIVKDVEEFAHYLAEPEARVMNAVLGNIRPGDTVWDVGANIGLYSLMMGRAVLPGGTVLAFEPMPWCHERLAQNIRDNQAPHVQAVPIALGARSERLFIQQCSSGLEGDIRVVSEAPAGTPSVQVMPGDQFRAQRGLAVPNMVKIDVQAAEEDVIIGLEKTLRDPACRLVICEIHYAIFATKNDANAPARIKKRLRDYGFSRLETIDRNHIGAFKQ